MQKSRVTGQDQNGQVHIDRIRVIGYCPHRPVGKMVLFGDAFTALAVKGSAVKGAPDYYVRSRHLSGPSEARQIELHVCPPQLLTQQNVFGGNDLVDLAVRCLESVIQQEEIQLIADPWRTWREGKFKVTEIHITGNLAMPRECVLPTIDAVDQNHRKGKHRDAETALTIGFSSTRRSRYWAVTLYDKWLLMKTLWKDPTPDQQRILRSIENSIRVELKLYSMQLKRLGLHEGWMWREKDLDSLYFEALDAFGVKNSIQRLLTSDELAALPLATRKVYMLWLKGVSVFDQFASKSTAWKHINLIREETGVECSGNRRPEALPALELEQVFSKHSLIAPPAGLTF